ncbi:MAG: peptidoglycan/xylan/chitin deacetylase (PgdA/CDA1 family) [Psychromonas sp.]|uniref:polysaccharide deacetylase family protein n=1 Tax=Psychromonas sp. TaxID=1884585 RepID=UPI0039E6FBE8
MTLIKKILLNLFFKLGIYQVFHFLSRHKITILYMHGIIDDTASMLWKPLRMQHTQQALAVTLKVLSEKYTFISLATAVEILKKQRPPVDNGLVITLDDGYLNNLVLGAPLFTHFNIAPTIFVATEHSEHNQPFWFDRLDYALQQITEENFQTSIDDEVFVFNCYTRKRLQQSYAAFRRKIKAHFKSDIAMRDYLCTLCQEIEQQTGKALNDIINSDPCAALADWQQLNHAKNSLNFEIGSHTLNHARSGLVDKHTASRELAESKTKLESKLDTHCTSFCYPDNSYNAHAVQTAAQYYDCALTTDTGLNKPNCSLMTLKRFNLPTNDNPLKILYAISALRNSFKL